MQETINYEHKKSFELDGIQYIYLKDNRTLNLNAVNGHDAIIVECSDNVLTRRFLEQFRSSEDQQIYLKPIVLYDRSGLADRITRTACDLHINDMDSLRSEDGKIQLIIDKLGEHE